MTNSEKNTPLSKIVKALTKVEPNELRATTLSFLFIFALMTAYFIIRPVRDAMASDWTRTETSFLWTLTFFLSIVAVSIFGRVISTVRFSRVVPGVYIFFAGSFVAFYFATNLTSDPTLVDKCFYVWLSVFSLFNVSVFWTFLSGIFSKEQAPRLFAVIMTGASVGAIVGPSIPAFFAEDIGVMNLMLISAAILLIPVPIIGALEKLKVTELGNEALEADLSRARRTGKSQFGGFSSLIRDPYLLAISLFILMYVTMNTFIYMELREFLSVFERAERTQIQASIDLAVNSLALLTALFATGRLATRFGMATTLSLIPILMVGGWMVVAAVPVLGVLVGLQIARRAGNYSVTKPGREMLFTLVDTETRYKTKPVIDTVVYRGGDMATAWLHTGLKDILALGLDGIAIVGAAAAAIWAAAAIYLGRTFDKAVGDESVKSLSGE